MKRIAMLIASAALLSACGGGSDQAESQAPATNESMAGISAVQSQSSTSSYRVAAPSGIVMNRVDRRLAAARGSIDVWVSLEQNSVAAQSAALAETSGMSTAEGGEMVRAMRAVRQGAAEHRKRISESQAGVASSVAALGGSELARVQVAHNAIAVRIDASQLTQLAAVPGVAKVTPVLNYEMTLTETVPYVGAAAVHAGGRDGSGVKVAVLDSGIDYLHAALFGSGNPADFAANNPDIIEPGTFPTAKVVGGYDFVGSSWTGAAGGPALAPDPDPLDAGPGRGHGTHVAHIIAGKGGVAPGASLYAVKVCSSVSTSCSGIALLQGMDFALDPNGDGDTSDAVDIINMSLGSPYGQIEDDLTLASTNAVKLGVIVVIAAGNDANKPYIVGSPSTAPGAISVANTQVPSAKAFPLVVNTPAAIAGVYANTATVDWAPVGAGATGDVVYIGRGCPAGSVPGEAGPDPILNNPSGKIALIDRGGCSVSLKVDYAAEAGANAVLIG
ncbi:MAG TPA: S8 family serine peptidase, partial [Burkholderiaceae bacterium]|nr:S8 family serine peptidase [Burkholderiaceae bacterium]